MSPLGQVYQAPSERQLKRGIVRAVQDLKPGETVHRDDLIAAAVRYCALTKAQKEEPCHKGGKKNRHVYEHTYRLSLALVQVHKDGDVVNDPPNSGYWSKP
jgi:hypothetical protein